MVRKARRVLGLNSGTSADGVDAVACEIVGRGTAIRVRIIGHLARPYPDALRKRLMAVMAPACTNTEEICRLDAEVGIAFADVAEKALNMFALKTIDFVGSHGQTICHLPPTRGISRRPRPGTVFATMQIADPSRIAARLACPVVHHFRHADMAVGGQGAPLVPWTDYVLFAERRASRIIQNIGGIANLTWLPANGSLHEVRAFDTGPGNMVIDALVTHMTHGQSTYDADGRLAARNRADVQLLSAMLRHPFFQQPAPKSCGREQFGAPWLRTLRQRFAGRRLSSSVWICTATELTARSIVAAWNRLMTTGRRRSRIDEVILCGGGARNSTLVSMLRQLCCDLPQLRNVRFISMNDFGISAQAKEGLSFAMLAAACMDGVPANLPQVTGARRPVVLGQVCDMEPSA